MEIAKEELGYLLHDRMTLINPKEEIPEDWNEQFNIPHREEDMNLNIQQAIAGLDVAKMYSSLKILQSLVAVRVKPKQAKKILRELVVSDYTE